MFTYAFDKHPQGESIEVTCKPLTTQEQTVVNKTLSAMRVVRHTPRDARVALAQSMLLAFQVGVKIYACHIHICIVTYTYA